MLHALSLGSVLSFLWLLLSGIFEAWLLMLGVGSVVIVIFFAHRMDVIDHEGHPIHIGWKTFLYWPWLAWEIIKSNVDVAKAILSPEMPIQPRVITIKASQVTELGHVFYANSITLTPGTLTLNLKNGSMEIHTLTKVAEESLLSGEMDLKVHDVEGSEDGTVRKIKNV